MLKHAWAACLWQFSSCSYPGLCYCHTQGSIIFLYAVYPAFLGPSSSSYPMYSSKQCYHWVSVVIYSHNMAEVSQEPLLYPVVFTILYMDMFLNVIIVQPISLCDTRIHSAAVLRSVSLSRFWSCKEVSSRQVSRILAILLLLLLCLLLTKPLLVPGTLALLSQFLSVCLK